MRSHERVPGRVPVVVLDRVVPVEAHGVEIVELQGIRVCLRGVGPEADFKTPRPTSPPPDAWRGSSRRGTPERPRSRG